jgi:hypothetical protein
VQLRTGLGAAFDLPGLGAGDVVRGDPISVVSSGGGNSGAGGGLLGNLGLNALGGLSALLAGLSGRLALLGEVRSDPNSVEEVTSAGDTSKKEEVEEDAGKNC